MSPRPIEHGDIVAGCVITNADHELLLLHRIKNNWWELPGGKVKFGESPKDAAIRETKEELGIEVMLTDPGIESPFRMNGAEYMYHVFGAVVLEGKPRVVETELHDDLRYFTQKQMRGLRSYDQLSPNVDNLLKKIIDGEINL